MTNTDFFNLKAIKDLTLGEYFRFSGKSIVYLRGCYSKQSKKFGVYKDEDISSCRQVKGELLVEVDFTY